VKTWQKEETKTTTQNNSLIKKQAEWRREENKF